MVVYYRDRQAELDSVRDERLFFMNNPVICITGGHQTPAIAVIEAVQKSHPQWKVVWVGRKYAFEGNHTLSPEYTLVRSMNIQFESLTTGRVQRNLSVQTFLSFFKIPFGIIQSVFILKRIHPNLIVSFGGYIAFPVSLAAFFLHIPIITHEQTHSLGLTNAFIAKIAQKVCVTYPETLSGISKNKGVLTGLPIRAGMFFPPSHPSFFVPKTPMPILYITGGSTGAVSMNDILFPVIPQLVKDMIVIHQTGAVSFPKASIVKSKLLEKSMRYIIKPFFEIQDMAWIYRHADVVMGRSGANTVAEIAAFGKKALFIPLPWSGGQEQQKNAEYYQEHGTARILDQNTVNSDSVVRAIQAMTRMENQSIKSSKASSLQGAAALVSEIEYLLSAL